MSKLDLHVAFSGGRSSAMMCYVVQNYKKYKDLNKIFIFTNTGKEREETLEFVDKVDKEFGLNLVWLEADVQHGKRKSSQYKYVNFKTASRNGEPFEEVIKKYGMPSRNRRVCTRELKIKPVERWLKMNFQKHLPTALGIRADEPQRIRKDAKKVYPLAEYGIDEFIVRSFWNKMPFDLKLKDYQGNCDLCFMKSTNKRLSVILDYPESAAWWSKMEKTYGDEIQDKFDVFRQRSVDDLVEMATDFDKHSKDKFLSGKLQPSMFSPLDLLDMDCYCGNE